VNVSSVPAYPGCPGQSPESRKAVVVVVQSHEAMTSEAGSDFRSTARIMAYDN